MADEDSMTPQPKSPNADLDRLDALYKDSSPGEWQCSCRGDGSGTVRNEDDIDAPELLDDSRCPYMRGEVRYEDGLFAAEIHNAYSALSRELRELRERLNPRPCTPCDGTGRVDTDADDGGANCGVCRNGMADAMSRKLDENERLRAALRDAAEVLNHTACSWSLVDSSTRTIGHDYGDPKLAKLAHDEEIRTRAAFAHATALLDAGKQDPNAR